LLRRGQRAWCLLALVRELGVALEVPEGAVAADRFRDRLQRGLLQAGVSWSSWLSSVATRCETTQSGDGLSLVEIASVA
jgi:hypothetical protein